jgi:hypothetical protein
MKVVLGVVVGVDVSMSKSANRAAGHQAVGVGGGVGGMGGMGGMGGRERASCQSHFGEPRIWRRLEGAYRGAGYLAVAVGMMNKF